MLKDYPEVKKVKNGNGNSNNGNHNNENNNRGKAGCPKTAGKIFAMSGNEASRSETMIKGKYIIRETPLTIMYDLSASHSFLVKSCVKQLNLSVIDLPFDLLFLPLGITPYLLPKLVGMLPSY